MSRSISQSIGKDQQDPFLPYIQIELKNQHFIQEQELKKTYKYEKNKYNKENQSYLQNIKAKQYNQPKLNGFSNISPNNPAKMIKNKIYTSLNDKNNTQEVISLKDRQNQDDNKYNQFKTLQQLENQQQYFSNQEQNHAQNNSNPIKPQIFMKRNFSQSKIEKSNQNFSQNKVNNSNISQFYTEPEEVFKEKQQVPTFYKRQQNQYQQQDNQINILNTKEDNLYYIRQNNQQDNINNSPKNKFSTNNYNSITTDQNSINNISKNYYTQQDSDSLQNSTYNYQTSLNQKKKSQNSSYKQKSTQKDLESSSVIIFQSKQKMDSDQKPENINFISNFEIFQDSTVKKQLKSNQNQNQNYSQQISPKNNQNKNEIINIVDFSISKQSSPIQSNLFNNQNLQINQLNNIELGNSQLFQYSQTNRGQQNLLQFKQNLIQIQNQQNQKLQKQQVQNYQNQNDHCLQQKQNFSEEILHEWLELSKHSVQSKQISPQKQDHQNSEKKDCKNYIKVNQSCDAFQNENFQQNKLHMPTQFNQQYKQQQQLKQHIIQNNQQQSNLSQKKFGQINLQYQQQSENKSNQSTTNKLYNKENYQIDFKIPKITLDINLSQKRESKNKSYQAGNKVYNQINYAQNQQDISNINLIQDQNNLQQLDFEKNIINNDILQKYDRQIEQLIQERELYKQRVSTCKSGNTANLSINLNQINSEDIAKYDFYKHTQNRFCQTQNNKSNIKITDFECNKFSNQNMNQVNISNFEILPTINNDIQNQQILTYQNKQNDCQNFKININQPQNTNQQQDYQKINQRSFSVDQKGPYVSIKNLLSFNNFKTKNDKISQISENKRYLNSIDKQKQQNEEQKNDFLETDRENQNSTFRSYQSGSKEEKNQQSLTNNIVINQNQSHNCKKPSLKQKRNQSTQNLTYNEKQMQNISQNNSNQKNNRHSRKSSKLMIQDPNYRFYFQNTNNSSKQSFKLPIKQQENNQKGNFITQYYQNTNYSQNKENIDPNIQIKKNYDNIGNNYASNNNSLSCSQSFQSIDFTQFEQKKRVFNNQERYNFDKQILSKQNNLSTKNRSISSNYMLTAPSQSVNQNSFFEDENKDRNELEQQKIGQNAQEENLIGHWNFDQKYAIDQTYNQNDIQEQFQVGPQQGGAGASAYFDGISQLNIKNIQQYNDSKEFTIAFWIYLIQFDGNKGWLTIFSKGDSNAELSPTIQLWPNSSKLHVKYCTEYDQSETIDSKGAILPRRWTHLAFTFSNQLVQIYINGQLDNQQVLNGQLILNDGNIHLGRDLWYQGPIFYMDDLRYYNKILKKNEIQNISAKGQILLQPNSATLGCHSCNYDEALKSCPQNQHLCYIQEIYAGAYQQARIMGWFQESSNFWINMEDFYEPCIENLTQIQNQNNNITHNNTNIQQNNVEIQNYPQQILDANESNFQKIQDKNNPGVKKLGICCSDI
ncbi:Concanavalin A-like lectin/glucanases superfamily [Pseudocohnilembus persalinus]|uniref:Concanavalin A-like lectin/glucanases superfamily n=1 Tax=Pseudocohnilembus persalinus TaxID=266149 RepID=A0A0V0QRI5_PSEPJ|nr:Concanavalin A-like lectin/glucanases superfamily [Pseudocohnilembus persalinus]|eukprot:KRX04942.1 Concanavalin A-like lectin/glucanases superfamily [Pseudocohnilembus persalinus]